MAFPTLAAISTPSSSSGTSHTVNLPSGIASGHILLMIFGTDGDNTVTNWGGFTELTSLDDGKDIFLGVAYKVATGSEGSTVTVTTSSSEVSCHYVLRFTNAGTPDCSTGASGDSTSPDPDSVTASASGDHIVVAISSNDGNAVTISAWPYADNNYEYNNGGAGGCTVGFCTDELNGSSFNPGTFTIDSGDEWCAATVCVPYGTTPETVQIGDAAIALSAKSLTALMAEVVSITKAALSLAAQAVNINIKEAVSITKGAILDTAQALNVNAQELVQITKAAILVTAQALAVIASEKISIAKANISLAAQALTTKISVTVSIAKAAILVTGQSFTLLASEIVSITKAAVSVAAQGLVTNVKEIIQIAKASIAKTGQAFATYLDETIQIAKAAITYAGRILTVTVGGVDAIVKIARHLYNYVIRRKYV